jgi:hypothetical protein
MKIGHNPVNARRKLQREIESRENREAKNNIKVVLSSLQPDFSQSIPDLPAVEGKFKHPIASKPCKFEHKPIDYSRYTENKTLDEIIEHILFPDKQKHRQVMVVEYANAGPAVAEYWRKKIRQSELNRGRAYKKIE